MFDWDRVLMRIYEDNWRIYHHFVTSIVMDRDD